MKASFDFNFGGTRKNVNSNNREKDNKSVELGEIKAHLEIEYSAQELVELLTSSEKGVKEAINFIKNDLANVINKVGEAVINNVNAAKESTHAINNHQLINHARAWKEASEIAGVEIPFQPFCKVISPTFNVRPANKKHIKEENDM